MWTKKDDKPFDGGGAAAQGEAEAAAQADAETGVEAHSDKKLAEQYYDQLLRLKAEFENYRKRTDRERGELIRAGRDEMLLKLLPVYDVLLTAHQQLQAHPQAGGLAKGVEMIFKEFNKVFSAESVAPIETVGKIYDHSLHEVLGTVERADLPDETVVDELQRGFTIEGKVLRPARVRISKKPAAAAADEQTAGQDPTL